MGDAASATICDQGKRPNRQKIEHEIALRWFLSSRWQQLLVLAEHLLTGPVTLHILSSPSMTSRVWHPAREANEPDRRSW